MRLSQSLKRREFVKNTSIAALGAGEILSSLSGKAHAGLHDNSSQTVDTARLHISDICTIHVLTGRDVSYQGKFAQRELVRGLSRFFPDKEVPCGSGDGCSG